MVQPRDGHYIWHVKNVSGAPGRLERSGDKMFLVMLKPLPRRLAFRRSSAGLDASRAGMLCEPQVHPTPDDASLILAVRFAVED